MEQNGTELGLELLDGPAQRRLGHVKTRGGPPEVALFGDGHEIAEQAEVHDQRRYPPGIRRTEADMDTHNGRAMRWGQFTTALPKEPVP
ncbi:hypothetical protein GCM10018779_52980 [Streptomyces griseocarneus]|nr:hypothetical protein GCM10018779_52980 [Streptomyces griseocarneus]